MKCIFTIQDGAYHTYIGLFEVMQDSIVFVAELLVQWFETNSYRVWMSEYQRYDFANAVRERSIVLMLLLQTETVKEKIIGGFF